MSTIKTRNAKFKAADKAQKRILIAKDVLAQLSARKFRPKQGAFVRMTFRKAPESGTQVCNLIEDSAPRVNCQACALGAMMLSEIRHTNALKVKSVEDGEGGIYFERDDQGDRLGKYFSTTQLRLVEIAFERGVGYYRDEEDHSIWGGTSFSIREKRAKAMFPLSKSPAKRMRAIMENIIANGGKFVI